ncbi:unnamed protein product [Rotaria magnacalcarata]|uniref:Homeobox domain-containing protein n=1 Tax=Rotaria magnacalcarata TaxID=392030 RepID=A0A8S2PCK7_9BILA|nr:unnamed protein product [Rotaria magnacalcarata]CAF4213099.1 unnamed protein product [Rotaria magnacalcarata]
MLTSTSSLEQSSSIMSNNKLSFPNTSNSFTSSQAATSINANSNSIGNNNGRYSSSNFYRAAAVAAVTGDPNNRRYMPSTPQRPSGERIAQIADKLDLKKNVVRVWFCNQRQKNKRLRFAAGQST